MVISMSTLGAIRIYLEHWGSKLLNTELRHPLKYICKCGKEQRISVGEYKKRALCTDCKRKRTYEVRKAKTQERLKALVIACGHEFIGSSRKGSLHVSYRCKCGQITEQSEALFRSWRMCADCKEKVVKQDRAKKYKEIQKEFKKAGCTLLAKEYHGSSISMHYRCCCGREAWISYGDFKDGCRCRGCAHYRGGKTQRERYWDKR